MRDPPAQYALLSDTGSSVEKSHLLCETRCVSCLFPLQRRFRHDGLDMSLARGSCRHVFLGDRGFRMSAERRVLRRTFLESSFGRRVREKL